MLDLETTFQTSESALKQVCMAVEKNSQLKMFLFSSNMWGVVDKRDNLNCNFCIVM